MISHQKMSLSLTCAAVLAAALSSCGSSGDDSSTPTPTTYQYLVRPSSYAGFPSSYLPTIAAIRNSSGLISFRGYIGAQPYPSGQDPLVAAPLRLTVRFYNSATGISYGIQTAYRGAAETTNHLDGATDSRPVWFYSYDFATGLNLPAATTVKMQVLDDGDTTVNGDELGANHVQLFVGDPAGPADNAQPITVTTIVVPASG